MESMFKNWVLYREDSNTHQEVYFKGWDIIRDRIILTDEVEDAMHFESAGVAYRFAGQGSELQWWRVGKR